MSPPPPPPPPPAAAKTAFEKALTPKLIDALTIMARRKVGNPTDAEDVASTTLLRAAARQRTKPWNPETDKAIAGYLLGIMDGVLADRRKRHKRKPEEELEHEHHVPSQDTSPEQDVAEADEDRRRSDKAMKLRQMLEDESNNVVPIAMLDAAEDGVEGPSAMADRIGCSVGAVRAAEKRMVRLAANIPRGPS